MEIEDLLRLKENIERGKTKLAELNGQKTQQLKTLLEDWGCATVEDAETKLETMNKKLDKLEKQIEDEVEQLKVDYPILFER